MDFELALGPSMERFARFDNPIETLTLLGVNGQKKMYSMNSTVIVDHDGLFIYVGQGYPGSFLDVTILRLSGTMLKMERLLYPQ
jgi:hypothetical protein